VTRRLLGFCLLLSAFGADKAADKASERLPPPYATPSVYSFPKIIPKPADAILHVPPGFRIEPFAEGFQIPRFLLLGPGGEILVSDSASRAQSPQGGTIYALSGAQKKILIAGLEKPYGMALWRDYLYVSEPESVKRYKYDSKSLSAGPGQEIISLKGQGTYHWTRTLLFDHQGAKLYVAVGSGSNHNIGEDERRAAISRYNPDGSGFEIFASGLRNPVGLRWYPGTDTLWTSVNERDELGDDLVPDYLTHVEPKGFYGWPYAYIGPHVDPSNSGAKLLEHLVLHPGGLAQVPEISKLVASTLTPDVLLGSHIAPLDILFYTGQQFPPEYRGGAFIALHGSVNRSKRIGYSIGFVSFQNGRPSGAVREVVTGWMLSPDAHEVWGRPVGLLQMSDGSVLISDDAGRRIWRLSYTGTH
jgi:glucose/arabinose dehydrogenase